MAVKPNVNSDAQKDLDKAEKQLEKFDENVKDLVSAREAVHQSPEHQISQKTIEKSPDLYIKPFRAIMSREKFNEEYREAYNEAKKYVQYTIQHEEARGDTIEMWTKPFAGLPAEFWKIPSGKPVWIPKYVADKLEFGCGYHRLKTQDAPTHSDGQAHYYGSLVVDEYVHRISARMVSNKRTFSMHRPAITM